MISLMVAALFAAEPPRDAITAERWIPNYVSDAEDSIQDQCMGLNKIYVGNGGTYIREIGGKAVCGKSFVIQTAGGRKFESAVVYGMGTKFDSDFQYVTIDDKGHPITNGEEPLREIK
jgi:hypothetical protein